MVLQGQGSVRVSMEMAERGRAAVPVTEKGSAAWRARRQPSLAWQIKAVPCGRRGENKAGRLGIPCLCYNLCREEEAVHQLPSGGFLTELFLPTTTVRCPLAVEPCLEMPVYTEGEDEEGAALNDLLCSAERGFPRDLSR